MLGLSIMSVKLALCEKHLKALFATKADFEFKPTLEVFDLIISLIPRFTESNLKLYR